MAEGPETIRESLGLFSNLYKYNGKTLELSQQQRRERFLEEQKAKRHQFADNKRQQCELFFEETSSNDDQMQCETVESYRSKQKQLNFKLMLSEWFIEIPDDLEDNWLVKFAPEGFRILLVARNRSTICYNTKSRIILHIKSNFPGGGGNESNGTTVLDCIYNKRSKTIFVLDCLYWNSMSMLDSEASFRFFWLKSKFDEQPDLGLYLKFRFILLNCMPAERHLIQDEMFGFLQVDKDSFSYDGVVFYHKESSYTFGYSPLVGWLASYMLPEMLNIDVSPENLVNKPKDYVCVRNYLENLSEKKKKQNTRMKGDEAEVEMEAG